MSDYWEIIERPLVSEKSIGGGARGKYVFRVKVDANKIQIRKAVETLYKVKVKDVNTLRVRGKTKHVGRHPEGRTTAWKKAIVTLAPGERIDVLEGV